MCCIVVDDEKSVKTPDCMTRVNVREKVIKLRWVEAECRFVILLLLLEYWSKKSC